MKKTTITAQAAEAAHKRWINRTPAEIERDRKILMDRLNELAAQMK